MAVLFEEVESTARHYDATAAMSEAGIADEILRAKIEWLLVVHAFEPEEEIHPGQTCIGFNDDEPLNIGAGGFIGCVIGRNFHLSRSQLLSPLSLLTSLPSL